MCNTAPSKQKASWRWCGGACQPAASAPFQLRLSLSSTWQLAGAAHSSLRGYYMLQSYVSHIEIQFISPLFNKQYCCAWYTFSSPVTGEAGVWLRREGQTMKTNSCSAPALIHLIYMHAKQLMSTGKSPAGLTVYWWLPPQNWSCHWIWICQIGHLSLLPVPQSLIPLPFKMCAWLWSWQCGAVPLRPHFSPRGGWLCTLVHYLPLHSLVLQSLSFTWRGLEYFSKGKGGHSFGVCSKQEL